MKSPFIIVRFDRMKNADLSALCSYIISTFDLVDGKTLLLEPAFNRFRKQEPLLNNLNPKYRKLPHTKRITELRKRMDNLIGGLLLNVKALKRADLPGQHTEIIATEKYLRKLFKNYIHLRIITKDSLVNTLRHEIAKKEDLYAYFGKLGLMLYADTIEELNYEIDNQKNERYDYKRQLPEPGITIPSKEEIISELRLLLQSITITVITHPENDYEFLINYINALLTEARAQLRNLASRRKTAKEKEKNKPGQEL